VWRESSVVKSTMEDGGVAANGGYDAGGWGDYANAVAGKIGAVYLPDVLQELREKAKTSKRGCTRKLPPGQSAKTSNIEPRFGIGTSQTQHRTSNFEP
jgi:hypothetical protein